jgi:N-acyl-phosphatidylethanolamine-hydrolysing phospholipase D
MGTGYPPAWAEEPATARPAHHAEVGFRNLGGAPGHGKAPPTVTIPFFARRVWGALKWGPVAGAPARVAANAAFLRENALGSVPTVTWIGHSTLLVQMGHVTFLTDPIWSRTASPLAVGPKRFVEPGALLEELPRIDFVVVSHNHYDHMDIPTLRALAARGTTVFVPLANGRLLRDAGIESVVELDWWQSAAFAGVEIHSVPAQHWSRRGIFDGDRALWAGWVVIADDRRFYFAGDTGLFPGFEEIGGTLGPFDLAALPIGAYEPRAMMEPAHLNPEEAIEAARMLGARKSIAVHFGTFDLSDEPVDEPPARFRAASLAADRGKDVDWVFSIGETRLW